MCGMIATIDNAGVLTAVRGDKEHVLTRGYACIKGLQAPELHNGPARLRAHHRREADGAHRPIGFDAAIDQVAAATRAVIDRHGPHAVAIFTGTQSAYNLLYRYMAMEFLKAIGSPSRFGTMTIDQSAKWVASGRLGTFEAGRHGFYDADVWLMAGLNPMVSLAGQSVGMPSYDPVKVIKDARARGMKLIVIDPVRTQTAANADLHLQPVPGEDPAIFAGLLHIVLREGWHDAAFCARYVAGLDALREAVAPFTPDYVAARAGLAAGDLARAARMFAHDARRGCAGGGTGPNMAPHSNLAEHLIECLNIVCGRFNRAGETIPEPGVLHQRRPVHAEVTPPQRSWERGHKSRTGGLGTMNKEMMSAILADEILHEGEGGIRALFCIGGNPANALPDQRHAVRALRALDLLVTSDAVWSETARLADYVFAARQPFERADCTYFAEELGLQKPFAQYTPAIVAPPAGSDTVEDWLVYFALGQRMGLRMRFAGRDLDMTRTPDADELLEMLAARGSVPLAAVKAHPAGAMFDVPALVVQPPREGAEGRFDLFPADVAAELADVLRRRSAPVTVAEGRAATHLLVTRRERETMNSFGRELSAIRARTPYNPLWLHPDDLAALGLAEGAAVTVHAEAGSIPAIARADAGVRPGVASMNHARGRLPGDAAPYEAVGASTARLIARDRVVETINAMPRMTAIPIAIAPRTSGG